MRGPRPPRYPPQTLKWLEARSRENMCFIYFEELIKIRDTGQRPTRRDKTLRDLLNEGLIIKTPPSTNRKWVWGLKLSETCQRIVEDMEKNGGGSM